MSLTIKRLCFGDQIAFVPDSTIITNSGGPVASGPTAPPDGTMPSDWAAFSTVEKGTITSRRTEEEVMAPLPDVYRRVDKIAGSAHHDIRITCQEINEVLLQAIFQLSAAPATSKVSIQTGPGQVRGWLRITRSSQADATAVLLCVYGILTCDHFSAEGRFCKPELDFAVIYNPGNTVTASLPGA